LHEKTRHYHWQGKSPLSIKTFFSGRALYTLGKGYFAVDDASYLLVNNDQSYTITIEADTPVESFCLFFEPGFAEEVHYSLITPAHYLLDDPVQPNTIPIHFFERTYRHDNLLSPKLFALRKELHNSRHDQTWLHQQFHELMQLLLQVHFDVYKEVESLPSLRAATREELYRRLYRAKDYASAFFDTPITLNDMARVASLSPNHFLRMFKHLFHQTPHQYLMSKRLESAQHLLLATDASVTEISFAVGFESLGSFSWLFQQRIGCSPTVYRTQKRGEFPQPS
jgi:AraC family transcriptional regulator